jgi:site-specific recombinase XerD
MRRTEKLVNVFERDLVRRGCTPPTLRRLLPTARAFLTLTGKPPRKIVTEDVRRYLASRSGSISGKSLAGELAHVRSLFAALRAAEVVEHDPTDGLTVKHAGSKPPVLLGEQSLSKLLATALVPASSRWSESRRKALALRDRACLELLYGLGLRGSEARTALVTDLHLADGSILVRRAKRGSPTFLPVPPASLDHLRRYLTDGRPLLADGRDVGRLLLSWRGTPLHESTIHQLVESVARRAGVRAHPHAFRRAVATGLIRSGVNVEVVRQVLGHSKLATTAIYMEVERDDLRAVMEHAFGGVLDLEGSSSPSCPDAGREPVSREP